MNHLPALTSIRAIAAFAVFLSHCSWLSSHESLATVWFVAEQGYIGVGLFYILSGFILFYNYESIEIRRERIFDFYAARFARVYPNHALTALVALPLFFWAGSSDTFIQLAKVGAVGLNVLLLQSWIPVKAVYFSVNGPSWSLSDEAFFYALYPFLAAYFVRCKVHGRAFRSLLIGLLTAYALLFLLAVTFRNHALSHWAFYVFPPVRLLDFSLGILCGMAYRHAAGGQFAARYSWALVAAGTIAVVVLVAFSNFVPQSVRYALIWLPPFFLVILGLSLSTEGGGRITNFFGRILSSQPFQIAGQASFAFYLIHQLVIRYVSIAAKHLGVVDTPMTAIALTGLAFTVSAVLSYSCWRFWEIPLQKIVKAQTKSAKLIAKAR